MRTSLSQFGRLRIVSVPMLISVCAHLCVGALLLYVWEKPKAEKRIQSPRYIEAKLVKLKSEAPKKSVKAKPKKVDLTKKKKSIQTKKTVKVKPKPVFKKATPKPQKPSPTPDVKKDQEKEREKLKAFSALEDALNDEEFMVAEQEMEQQAQSYIAAISGRIEQNWSRPPSARNGMRCELLIQLVPTGRVVEVSVVESSGNRAFDRSAEQAVKKVDIFPEIKTMPPEIFEKYYRQLRLVFNPQDLRQ